jgi:hypothetical protein
VVTLEALTRAVGSPLETLITEVHTFGDERSTLSVWFGFEGLKRLRLSCAVDGSLRVSDDPVVEPLDMGEAGRTDIVDAGADEPFAPFVGRKLSNVSVVRDRAESKPWAVRLLFEGPTEPLVIANWGDDLHLGFEYPKGWDGKGLNEELIG